MLKVVIFDSGWGGELVADYIEEELNIIDVIRVIDWRHAPYEAKGQLEICCLVEAALKPYIGRVEVVVLASFEAGLALDYLKEAYPEQKFVKMPFDLWEIKHSKLKPHRVMILAGQKLQRK